jgi:hypothetical protein
MTPRRPNSLQELSSLRPTSLVVRQSYKPLAAWYAQDWLNKQIVLHTN